MTRVHELHGDALFSLASQWGETDCLLNSSRRNFCTKHSTKKIWGHAIQSPHYFCMNWDRATGRPSVMFTSWRKIGMKEGWVRGRRRVGRLLHCRESSWNPLAVLLLNERGKTTWEDGARLKDWTENWFGEIDVNGPLVGWIVLYLYAKLKSDVSLPVLPKEENKTTIISMTTHNCILTTTW